MTKALLLIDDPEHRLVELSQSLARAGYPVHCLNEDDAVARFSELAPELVIIELYGGGGSGVTLTEQIRSRPEGAILPILFIGTGGEMVTSVSDALAVGGDYFFQHPLTVERVLAKVRSYIGAPEETNETTDPAQSPPARDNDEVTRPNVRLPQFRAPPLNPAAGALHELDFAVEQTNPDAPALPKAELEALKAAEEKSKQRWVDEQLVQQGGAEIGLSEALEPSEPSAEARAQEEAEHRALELEAQRQIEEDLRRKRAIEEEALRRAEEEIRQRAEEEARKQAAAEEARRRNEEAARKRAEDEARRRLEEETRRRAEEEALRRAEEEIRHKAAEEELRRQAALEAERRAEEQAMRRAEEELRRRRAEDDARRRLEEETRRRAEEEALRRAEEDIRRKAEEEATRRAEELAKRRTEEELRRQRDEAERRLRALEETRLQLEAEQRERQREEQLRVEMEEQTKLRLEQQRREHAAEQEALRRELELRNRQIEDEAKQRQKELEQRRLLDEEWRGAMITAPSVDSADGRPVAVGSATLAAPRTLSGDLAVSDLARVFSDLIRERTTGKVRFTRGKTEKTVGFENGRPVEIVSSDSNDRLEEFLVRNHLLTRPQYQAVRLRQLGTPRTAAAFITGEGYLKAEELFDVVRRHFEDCLLGLFEWQEGSFLYVAEPVLAEERIVLPTAPERLVVDGVRRRYLLDRMMKLVGTPASLLVAKAGLQFSPEVLGLDRNERQLYKMLDGSRSIEDLVFSTGLSEQRVYQVLVALEALQLVEVAVRGIAGSETFDVRSNEIDRARIAEEYELAKKANYFELLGLSRGATEFDIERAISAARQAFSRDRFSREVAAELANELEEIEQVLSDAEYVLKDNRLRESYQTHMVETYALTARPSGQ